MNDTQKCPCRSGHGQSSKPASKVYLVCNLQICYILAAEISIEDDAAAEADVVHVIVGVLQREELEEARQQP